MDPEALQELSIECNKRRIVGAARRLQYTVDKRVRWIAHEVLDKGAEGDEAAVEAIRLAADHLAALAEVLEQRAA
jgi:hypothetical protein